MFALGNDVQVSSCLPTYRAEQDSAPEDKISAPADDRSIYGSNMIST